MKRIAFGLLLALSASCSTSTPTETVDHVANACAEHRKLIADSMGGLNNAEEWRSGLKTMHDEAAAGNDEPLTTAARKMLAADTRGGVSESLQKSGAVADACDAAGHPLLDAPSSP